MGEKFAECLGTVGRYLVCYKERQPNGNGLVSHNDQITVEHVFPQSMKRWHPDILRDVIDEHMNHVPFCRRHHDVVERAKELAYKEQSIAGLTLYICAQYPRSIHSDLLELQEKQWRMLLTEVKNNIGRLNGNVAPHLLSGYSIAAYMIENYLVKWEQYGFSQIDF